MRNKKFIRWFQELKQLYLNRKTKTPDEVDNLDELDYFDYWADGYSPRQTIDMTRPQNENFDSQNL